MSFDDLIPDGWGSFFVLQKLRKTEISVKAAAAAAAFFLVLSGADSTLSPVIQGQGLTRSSLNTGTGSAGYQDCCCFVGIDGALPRWSLRSSTATLMNHCFRRFLVLFVLDRKEF